MSAEMMLLLARGAAAATLVQAAHRARLARRYVALLRLTTAVSRPHPPSRTSASASQSEVDVLST